MTCYLMIRTATAQQEHYESASNDARQRARELRKAGFRVFVSSMGPQVTSAGIVRMTMLTIEHRGEEVPAPEKTERL